MSKRYALFFDIDGTLVSFKTHEIPPSSIFALTALLICSKVFFTFSRLINDVNSIPIDFL